MDGGTARAAYDLCAPVYDAWNSQNNYEMWLGEFLLPELEKFSLAPGWALDVGCGTGKAFQPLLSRGWRVVGCDVSEGMLREANEKFGPQVRLLQRDARSLGRIAVPGSGEGGRFQLALLLNDVINYLIDDGDLERVLAGVKQNLSRTSGLAIFDLNTLSLFRDIYSIDSTESLNSQGWSWRGCASAVNPGGTFEGVLSAPGVPPHTHTQRHWRPGEVIESLASIGLHPETILGQREDDGRIILSSVPDEERDSKLVYIVRRVG